MVQRLAILGSTGSIGVQTLDVVRAYPERFEATVLTAATRWRELAAQAREFLPDSVVIADKEHYRELSDALADLPIKVYAGSDAVAQIAGNTNVDTVVNALVGFAGLRPTIAALRAGKRLALANKESLVVAGDLVMPLALEKRIPIVPIDSEHSAIFQCLVGEQSPIENIILTASGGPFRTLSREQMQHVSVAQTLAHPKWNMGAKITVDSASLLNKGFEVIEAYHLFGVKAERIKVVIHPQSIVHSMVEFADGAIKAQLGTPDMHLPIQYALTFPERLPIAGSEPFSFIKNPTLSFEQVNNEQFPNLGIAYECLRKGGNACCVLNAANEVAVKAFLDGKIGFTTITNVIEYALAQASFVARPVESDFAQSDTESREIAQSFLKK